MPLALPENADGNRTKHSLVPWLLEQIPRHEKVDLAENFAILTNGNLDSAVTATDLHRLSAEVGEPLSLEECSAMMGSKTEWSADDVRMLLS